MGALGIAPGLSSQVQVHELFTGEEQDWDRYVLSSESATFFHRYGWGRVVEKIFGHRCFRLIARRGAQVTGVLPVSLVRNRIFGDCLVSMPLAVYGGIAADDKESFDELLKAGTALAEKFGVKYLEMRNQTELFPVSLPGKDLYVSFSQDLRPGPDKLLQALPRDTRYMVRKSLKSGLEWTEDIRLDEFYEIYARSVHRLGTPVFPRKLFALLRQEFPEHSRIFGVRKGGTAIAAVFCFYFRNQVLPYYGGSLAEFNREAPNNFMYWSLIVQSCQEGITHFDFGRSKKGTGAYAFKSGWSMQEVSLPYRYQLVRAREVPNLSPVDRKFQLPTAIWKRLPFASTKVLGPRLIRWIPSI